MMKKQLVVMALAVASIPAWADVKISAPEHITVMAIDGQDVKRGFLKAQKSEYKVDAGQHIFHVRYEQFFDHVNSDEHDIIKSDTVMIETPALVDGEQYQLKLTQSIQDIDSAREFARNPSIGLYNQQGQLVAQHQAVQSQSTFAGGLFTRSYDFTKSKKPTVAPSTSTVTQPATSSVKPVSAPSQKGQALIQLWQSSSSTDREAFLIWLNQQSR